MRSILPLLTLVSAIGCLNACTVQEVKPWERNLLAKENMQLDPFPIENALDEHIFFSKEASSGGQGIGGGGCGCN